MVPRLFISASLPARVGEMKKALASHMSGGNLDIKSHPDVLYFEVGSKLGIEQARMIKEHFSMKPFQLEGKIVVLEDAAALTLDAQNALLKTFEEAPEQALILLGAGSEQDLLPTVLSRCEIVYVTTPGVTAYETPEVVDFSSDIGRLLGATVEERFGYIETLKEKDEFLKALLAYFRNELLTNKRSHLMSVSAFLEELLLAEKWAKQNVNIRAILEYLMLKMPRSEV